MEGARKSQLSARALAQRGNMPGIEFSARHPVWDNLVISGWGLVGFRRFLSKTTGSLLDPARFNTCGAYHHFFGLSVAKRTHALKIWVEAAFIDIVGMAHIAADHGFFPADFTLSCHFLTPSRLKYKGQAPDSPDNRINLHILIQ